MGEGYREGSEEWRMAMRNDFQDNPGVIAPPPLIYAGVLVVGLLLRLIFPTRFLAARKNQCRPNPTSHSHRY